VADGPLHANVCHITSVVINVVPLILAYCSAKGFYQFRFKNEFVRTLFAQIKGFTAKRACFTTTDLPTKPKQCLMIQEVAEADRRIKIQHSIMRYEPTRLEATIDADAVGG